MAKVHWVEFLPEVGEDIRAMGRRVVELEEQILQLHRQAFELEREVHSKVNEHWSTSETLRSMNQAKKANGELPNLGSN